MATNITPTEVALAAEAINRVPGLSPLARRVGLELINRTDRQSGMCYPSESRLAVSLGCDARSVRRAKQELRAASFLDWQNPGHHKRSRYRVMFDTLVDLAKRMKRKITRDSTRALLGDAARKAQEFVSWQQAQGRLINSRKAAHAASIRFRRFITGTNLDGRILRLALSEPAWFQRYWARTSGARTSDRTKMSYNPTTHINQSLNNTENKPKPQPQKDCPIASRAFWGDVAGLSTILAEQINNALTEPILSRALEMEANSKGGGIRYAFEAIKGSTNYECA